MKSLYEPIVMEEVIKRFGTLTPSHQALWGHMNATEMLSHCTKALELATGECNLPRTPFGLMIGSCVKILYYNARPLPRNVHTYKPLIGTDSRGFSQEYTDLQEKITRFVQAGEAGCTQHPHPFFGDLTPRQWSIGMYKHLDHHLRQFGI